MLAQALNQQPDYVFTFNNSTYTQLKNVEEALYIDKYQDNETKEILTIDTLFSRNYPTIWKSIKINITPPAIISQLSTATRMKILRIVQNHYAPPPPITDMAPLSFFSHYRTYLTDVSSTLRDFDACRFATGQNDLMAASLFMFHGPCRGKKEIRQSNCSDVSLLKITQKEDGIYIHFKSPIDLQNHFKTCQISLKLDYLHKMDYLGEDAKISKEMSDTMKSAAYKQFFTYNGHVVSAPREITTTVLGGIGKYLLELKKTPPSLVDSIPFESLPSDIFWLEDYGGYTPVLDIDGATIFIPFEDFIIETGPTIAQQVANYKMRYDRTLETLTSKIADHPDWNSTTPYSRTEVKEWFSSNTLKSAIDKGFIDNSQRGKYYFKFLDIKPPDEDEDLDLTF